ncbi:slipin family protein [Spirosoma telluris]|uniref:slipin family protein n=1 Tax=Spirosoma telluris TaxID=2183553 RepID=UPI002FC39F57
MKTVRILARQIGLVFKYGGYQKLLLEGNYWVWSSEIVYVYNRDERLQNLPCDLAVLLEYPEIAAELDVIEVKDNEIALQYESDHFQSILQKGRWAYWKGVKNYTYQKVDFSNLEIPANINLMSIMSTPLSAFVRMYPVEAHEQGVLFIDWKFDRVLTAGTYYWWKNNVPIHVLKVDTRQQQLEVSGQEILTKDKASLRLSFYVQYHVQDIIKALVANKDYDKQLYIAVQLALREYIGGLTLDELLDKKGELAPFVVNATAAKAAELGLNFVMAGFATSFCLVICATS